jgi:transcriptional regulator with PAS, ATPase and Fis domain
VAAGQFREDLFYRLDVFTVHLPAPRERGDDVLLLADPFVRTLGARMGKGEPGLSRDAREVLLAHPWPGNIRELANAIERALIVREPGDDGLITAADLALAATPSRRGATRDGARPRRRAGRAAGRHLPGRVGAPDDHRRPGRRPGEQVAGRARPRAHALAALHAHEALRPRVLACARP